MISSSLNAALFAFLRAPFLALFVGFLAGAAFAEVFFAGAFLAAGFLAGAASIFLATTTSSFSAFLAGLATTVFSPIVFLMYMKTLKITKMILTSKITKRTPNW